MFYIFLKKYKEEIKKSETKEKMKVGEIIRIAILGFIVFFFIINTMCPLKLNSYWIASTIFVCMMLYMGYMIFYYSKLIDTSQNDEKSKKQIEKLREILTTTEFYSIDKIDYLIKNCDKQIENIIKRKELILKGLRVAITVIFIPTLLFLFADVFIDVQKEIKIKLFSGDFRTLNFFIIATIVFSLAFAILYYGICSKSKRASKMEQIIDGLMWIKCEISEKNE